MLKESDTVSLKNMNGQQFQILSARGVIKVAFSESAFVFEIPVHNITLLWAETLNFKFRIVFLIIFWGEIWRFEKRIALSEKSHL